ncbi:hypothetical protein [Melaminivora alkalimesophila]|uniref:Uncharacterized protein n=1 Tax=Melaminivora alkalimesophila TaxID=1165852 RepID=A0A317RBS8_9BURK|nr:hypothetical protein [Melaminivora alkalimesophila]PWW46964.1 hypothetical protein DFR36_103239 [Melaminivora alkalimesophila]
MSNRTLTGLALAAGLALTAGGAWAQAGNAASPTTATTPSTTVGTTDQEARQATREAVPRSDTATLVRTGPSAAERAADMTKNDDGNAPPATPSQALRSNDAHRDGAAAASGAATSTSTTADRSSTAANGNAATAPAGASSAERARARAPRADRN